MAEGKVRYTRGGEKGEEMTRAEHAAQHAIEGLTLDSNRGLYCSLGEWRDLLNKADTEDVCEACGGDREVRVKNRSHPTALSPADDRIVPCPKCSGGSWD